MYILSVVFKTQSHRLSGKKNLKAFDFPLILQSFSTGF